MDLTTPTGPYEWMGGTAALLHTLLHTDEGREFLTTHHHLTHAEELYATYRQWLSKSLADAEATFGVDRGAA